MIDVVTCMAVQHEPWLVLLAAGMCLCGAVSVMQLFGRSCIGRGLGAARRHPRRARLRPGGRAA
jgi:NO-binding membrane sensor protein with MHYT domain